MNIIKLFNAITARIIIPVFFLAYLTSVYTYAQEKHVSIAAVGDIMLSRGLTSFLEKESMEHPFKKIQPFLKENDIVIGNLECFLSTDTSKPNSSCFKASTSTISGLKFAGFNVLTVANNHSFDGGWAGLQETIQILKDNKIQYTGAGKNLKSALKPASIKVNKNKIAVLACSSVLNKGIYATVTSSGILSPKHIEAAIRKNRVFYDTVIVCCHWGIEYTIFPTEYQKKLAHKLIDAGAEMVIGHHPHIIQGIEIYKGRLIAYSLGNFIFDNPSRPTSHSFILKVILKQKSKVIELWPIERKKSVIRQVTGVKAKYIINKIVERSFPFKTKLIIAPDNSKITLPLKTNYIDVSKSKKQLRYYTDKGVIFSCRIATGINDCTPTGRFVILNKILNPSWRDDNGKTIKGNSTNNPLGSGWLGIDRWNLRTKRQYGIHGTTDTTRIGKMSSRGCIELTNTNILKLYKLIDAGTEVFINSD